ncbi:MAG: recombinase family protein [Planctomycetota bacterium]
MPRNTKDTDAASHSVPSHRDDSLTGLPAVFTQAAVEGRRIAVSYSRYSSDLQSESSLPDQQRKCEEKASALGQEIAYAFEDAALSGAKHDRPGFQALLRACRAGVVSTVFAESQSRLTRDFLEAQELVRQLPSVYKVRLIFIDDAIDTNGGGAKLLASINGITNEMQLDTLRHQVKRGQTGVVRGGFSVGDLRYGYTSEPVDPDAAAKRRRNDPKPKMRYKIDQEQADWVKWIFERYANDHWGLRQVAKSLNDQKVPRDSRAQRDQWTFPIVREILACRKYIGEWEWGAKENVRDTENGRVFPRQRDAESPE